VGFTFVLSSLDIEIPHYYFPKCKCASALTGGRLTGFCTGRDNCAPLHYQLSPVSLALRN